ncbi:MAG: LytTR family transcriptional regulator DNA-binding domain-containing protein [Chitinophagales bacterium]|nr:LytTR family transcriptional regulator DNA-binding domain-containing protein [Chitinophagales bacterium]
MNSNINLLNAPIDPPSRGALYRQAVLIGIGIFGVLAVFQPFGTYVFKHELKYLILAGYGLLVPLTAFVLRESVALLWSNFFAPGQWNFKRELVFSTVFLLLAVTFSYVYQRLAIGGQFSFFGFLSFIFYAITTAILPMGFFLAWRFFDIKNRLLTHEFSEKLAQMPATAQTPAEALVVLQGENKHEKLTLLRADILFLRAADNYVEIFLQKDGQTQRLMLRGALSNLFLQLNKAGAFRQVHRSYVVNFDHPVRLEGKSPTYFLVFDKTPDAGEIPVSRSAVADIRDIIASKPR